MTRIRTLILGAAGRDFHNFNVLFRKDPTHEVVGFTAQQIPHIADRRYPPGLSGALYPEGIAIYEESSLERLIRTERVTLCVLAYSDLSYDTVGHLASRANAAGADFILIGAARTMLRSMKPVVAVCATRTGAGKSQTSREVVRTLRAAGLNVAVLRHPMPYGDLGAQRVQRFADAADLDRHDVTIEEREEYEPHLAMQSVVWAGVDYASILREAQNEADVIVWDGGNNDTSFIHADVYITVVDPLRAGHEAGYYPGETNVRLADVIVINKIDAASPSQLERVRDNVAALNPKARVIEAASTIEVDRPELLRNARVLAIDDGPTLTHGGMSYGAAVVAAQRCGATLIDPRPYAVGEVADALRNYPHIGAVLPALGYGDQQLRDMEATIAAAARDGITAVAIGTPIDLAAIMRIPVPWTRVRYALVTREPDAFERLLYPITSGTAGLQAQAPAVAGGGA